MCLEGSTNAMHGSGFKANYQDLTSKHCGGLTGVGNTVATLASTLGPLATAHVLHHCKKSVDSHLGEIPRSVAPVSLCRRGPISAGAFEPSKERIRGW